MLIGSPVPRDLPCALGRAVCYKYPPLNEVSCVYWYLVGGYSPQTPQFCARFFNTNPSVK